MKTKDQNQLEFLYESISNKQENFHYPGETTDSAIEKYIKNGRKEHLYLPGTLDLVTLPSNLKFVGGNLILTNCINLEALPDNLTVMGNLDLYACKQLRSLPKNLKVGGYLDLGGSGIRSVEQLPDDLRVVGPITSNKFSEEEVKQHRRRRRRMKELTNRVPELEGVL
jgi:hypothetical protein